MLTLYFLLTIEKKANIYMLENIFKNVIFLTYAVLAIETKMLGLNAKIV